MELLHHPVFEWLSQFAYQPYLVYTFVYVMMMASGFGLPLPEEITIVSIGFMAFMGKHPELYPPPYPGAPVVKMIDAAIVVYSAVICSDLLIFTLGRVFGRRIMSTPRFSKVFPENTLDKLHRWSDRYGMWAVGIFRFTPGFRFPGHLMCGITRISVFRFLLVDGLAAMISVPTQVYLVSTYGEPILHVLHKLKIVIGLLLGLVVIGFVGKAVHNFWIRDGQEKD